MSTTTTLSAGQLLREERARQNKTQNELARQLRLTLVQIDALENDRYESLPGATFVRGFLRNYARCLSLDQEAIIQAYEASLPPPLVYSDEPPAKVSYRPPYKAAGVAMVVIVLVGAMSLLADWAGPNLSHLNFTAQLVPSFVASPGNADKLRSASSASTQNRNQSIEGVAAAPLPAPAPEQAISKEPVNLVEPVADVESLSVAGLANAQELLARLKFSFNEDAWVEVRDQDQQKVFAHLNIKGTQKVVEVLPPMSLVVGNARAVRITYNDTEVDLTPHIKNNIARFSLD